MMTSTSKKSQTDVLKVDVGSPSSYSFHSLSGSPTTDEIEEYRHVASPYPATPPIADNTSYTLSPQDHNTFPITPIICNSPSSCYQIGSDTFPDTIATKIALDEIDEKKQFDEAQSRQPTPPPAAAAAAASVKSVKPDKKSSIELEEETLGKHGYKRRKYIADTLQGQTFLAQHEELGEVVIKKTRKDLYNRGITISKEGKAFNIKEDIVSEADMMAEFMLHNPPASLIAFHAFFEDSSSYYLAMENGGRDFFDFVVDCHELIGAGKLSMKEWRKQCKFMFAQMIECILWMHSVMKYCHLDISLENILISNDAHFDENTGKLSKCYIKFIDFGLAQSFDLSSNPNFLTKKFVGKTHYKSPKVYGKKEAFMANKADVWSLGVCLFMMVIGAPPYNKPIMKDAGFRFIKNKKITKLLYSWNRIKYVTPNLYDLMEKMLNCDESERISMDDIICHDWIKIYFGDHHHHAAAVPVSSPMSPSYSTSFTQSASTSASALNIMIPQHAVSISATPRNGQSSTPRKASTSYPYPVHRGSKSKSKAQRTPTPIIESHTSTNDCSSYYAALDAIDHKQMAQKENQTKSKNKNKKKKKFFKLSLSIFHSKKNK